MNPDQLYLNLSRDAYRLKHKNSYIYKINGEIEDWVVVKDKSYTMTDADTGFDALVVKKDDHIVVSFRGTEGDDKMGRGFQDLVTDIKHILIKNPVNEMSFNPKGPLGKMPIVKKKNQFQQAIQLIKDIKTKNPNVTITVTGHSLGGALAQYVAAKFNLSAVTYSAPSVVDLLDKNTKEKVLAGEFDTTIINYVHPKDSIGAGGLGPYERHVGSTFYIGSKFNYENRDYEGKPFNRLFDSIGDYHSLDHFKFDKYGYLNNPVIFNVLAGIELFQSPRYASSGGLIELAPVDIRQISDVIQKVCGEIEEDYRTAKASIQNLLIDESERSETHNIGYEILDELRNLNKLIEEDLSEFIYSLRMAADEYEKADKLA